MGKAQCLRLILACAPSTFMLVLEWKIRSTKNRTVRAFSTRPRRVGVESEGCSSKCLGLNPIRFYVSPNKKLRAFSNKPRGVVVMAKLSRSKCLRSIPARAPCSVLCFRWFRENRKLRVFSNKPRGVVVKTRGSKFKRSWSVSAHGPWTFLGSF